MQQPPSDPPMAGLVGNPGEQNVPDSGPTAEPQYADYLLEEDAHWPPIGKGHQAFPAGLVVGLATILALTLGVLLGLPFLR